MSGRGVVTKNSGDVGNSGFNSSLGKRNPVPNPRDRSSETQKTNGVKRNPTRFPYDSKKGEIRNHRGL